MTNGNRALLTRPEWALLLIAVIITVPIRAAVFYDWSFPARIWWESLAFGLPLGLIFVFLLRFHRKHRR